MHSCLSFNNCSSPAPTNFPLLPIPYFAIDGEDGGNGDSIHRFFDSNPFSPSSKRIAYTKLPEQGGRNSGRNSYGNSYAPYALVKTVDLETGEQLEVDKTMAWGSQVGCHVQWGSSDRQLFYNSLSSTTSENTHDDSTLFATQTNNSMQSGITNKAYGVVYDMETKEKALLQCPIYHVSSDGKFAVAPNLYKIKYTQKGYGIDEPSAVPNGW